MNIITCRIQLYEYKNILGHWVGGGKKKKKKKPKKHHYFLVHEKHLKKDSVSGNNPQNRPSYRES